jgi:carboxymethylenebutenolidase
MKRMTAKDFDPRVLKLFDGFVHGAVSRREFLDKAAAYTAGGITAAMLLDQLTPRYALAAQVAPDDARIKTEMIEYASPNGTGTIKGLLVHPTDSRAPVGAVLVIHENRGLNPYIEDVARRAGAAGFIALAPDGLTSLGGYPGDDEKGKEMQATLAPEKLFEDWVAGIGHLKTVGNANGKIGAVGFCYGGGVCHNLAVRLGSELTASVPFYGRAPAPEEAAKVQAPLLVHLAETDERVNESWGPYEAALKEQGKEYTVHIYPGTQHGFHNDTTPRYDAEAAELAWTRTIDFFKAKLA